MNKALTFSLLILTSNLLAQQTRTFVYNPNLINPSFMATNPNTQIWSSYGRINFGGEPRKDFTFNLAIPLKSNHNIGLCLNAPLIGSESYETIANYNISLRNNERSINFTLGTNAGLGKRKRSQSKDFNYNILGFNALFHTKIFYIGVSIPQIISKYKSVENTWAIAYPDFFMYNPVYGMGGLEVPISKSMNIKFSALANFLKDSKTEKMGNLSIELKNKVMIGFSYTKDRKHSGWWANSGLSNNYWAISGSINPLPQFQIGVIYDKEVNYERFMETSMLNFFAKYNFIKKTK